MTTRHGRETHRLLPTIALAPAGCLWGTGFLFANVALSEMPVVDPSVQVLRPNADMHKIVGCLTFDLSRRRLQYRQSAQSAAAEAPFAA